MAELIWKVTYYTASEAVIEAPSEGAARMKAFDPPYSAEEVVDAEEVTAACDRYEVLRRQWEAKNREATEAFRAMHKLGVPLGHQDHSHGSGSWGDRIRWHAHPFTDENHTHPRGSAEDAPEPEPPEW